MRDRRSPITAILAHLKRRLAPLQTWATRFHRALQVRGNAVGRSETMLRLILESATDYAILTFDERGRVITWNPGARRIFGYDEDEIIGRDVAVIFTPEDRIAGAMDLEMQTAFETGRADDERWHIRKDGTRFWGSGRVMPIRRRDQRVQGFLKILRDRTEDRRAKDALMLTEKRYRALVTATALIVWQADASGAITEGAPGWEALTGQTPEQYRGWGWMAVVHPDDLPPLLETWAKAREDRVQTHAEFRVRSKEGAWHSLFAITVPVFDAEGQVREWIGTLTDVTRIRAAEAHQRFLMDELTHRVKNTLAEVQAIAAHTLRTATSPEAFQADFGARLKALSMAHELLMQGNWKAAKLRDIVLAEIQPYAGDLADRFILEGTDVRLGPRAALALAMAFHELATNAAKYGALSVTSGRVAITWKRLGRANARRLRIEWTEAGGPAVGPPARRGFGSTMIERGVGHALGGTVDLAFEPAGIRCTMEIPVRRGGEGADRDGIIGA